MVTIELLKQILPPWPLKMVDLRPDGRDDWYFCQICARAYPIYWVPRHIWRASGYGKKSICKHCLEEKIPNPEYCTIEEYLADNHYGGEERLKHLRGIWDLPEEAAPAPLTRREIQEHLSRGECTICFAKSPAEVRKMCALCARETCIGPCNLDLNG